MRVVEERIDVIINSDRAVKRMSYREVREVTHGQTSASCRHLRAVALRDACFLMIFLFHHPAIHIEN